MFDLGFGSVGFEPLQAWLLSDLPTVTATVTFCFRVCGFDPVRNFCGWLLFSAPSLPRVVQRSSLGVVSFV